MNQDSPRQDGLSVLLVEDSLFDAQLVEIDLQRGGLNARVRRVETRADFLDAVGGDRFDVILSDFSLPEFDGGTALELARQYCPDTPFIYVSGVMGEETAIDSLKQGATDYVLKRRRERLVPAIRRALSEVALRDERRRAELALRQSESNYRRLAQELAEADRRKDEFLAMLAHELRNPLAPIRNSLHLLRIGDPTQATKLCDMMDRQVDHMVRMVDDLLDISRIQRGKIKLRREPVDLRSVVQQAAESTRPLIDARGHTLEVNLPETVARVNGDTVRLVQVVANLLSNAAKYTPEKGTIRLTLSQDGGQAVLRVKDNGQGIPPEMLDAIFDLFVQVNRELDRAEGGLGLGLTLVRRLVGMHGGTVTATSSGVPGEGSEFIVRLPTVSRVEDGKPSRRPTDEEVNRPRKVLVVDDNRDAADSLALLLEVTGNEVKVAYDGPQALALVLEERPDSVLLDIGLPGMSGHDVARAMRAMPTLEGVQLIAVTGYGSDRDRKKSAEAGFQHHLLKPVDLRELQRMMAATPAIADGVVC